MGVELFRLLDEDEVLVIRPDYELFTAALEPVTQFLQSPFDGQKLSVHHTLALPGGVDSSGEETSRVQLLV